MKNTIYLFISLLLFIFISSCCSKKPSELLPELQYAESIMYSHPDSALSTLKQMQMPNAADRLNHATWCLLISDCNTTHGIIVEIPEELVGSQINQLVDKNVLVYIPIETNLSFLLIEPFKKLF